MVTASLEPIPDRSFGFAEAQHLLLRAGFGGSARQIQALATLGPEAAVDGLVDFEAADDPHDPPEIDPDIMKPLTPEQRREVYRARQRGDEAVLARYRQMRNKAQASDRRQLRDLQPWWVRRMIRPTRPLQEKLVLLWHGHFATHYRGCEDAYLLYRQNQLFRTHAAGNFGALVQGIVRDPAMLVFLNNDRNRKGQPNENLARELMELFTLGEGQYRETDIHEAARALTGYTRHDNDFVFRQAWHDTGTKHIFGVRGGFDGDDLAKLCLARPGCADFVAYKLYRCFVTDVAEPTALDDVQLRVVRAMARQLRAEKYELRPVLRTLFRSRHFYDPANRAAKIKGPLELLVGLVRTLETPTRDARVLAGALRRMGQEPFNPPNVAGWPGGRSWINTATLFVRQNLATYLVTGRPPFGHGWSREKINYDATKLIARLAQPRPAEVVAHLAQLLLGAAATGHRREQLEKFLADHRNRITNDSVIALVCLITAMPEYQLC